MWPFKNKRIIELDRELENTKWDLDLALKTIKNLNERVEKLEKNYPTSIGVDLAEHTWLYVIVNHIAALMNYLDVDVKWNFEPDESAPKPEPVLKKVWKVIPKTETTCPPKKRLNKKSSSSFKNVGI